MSGQFIDSCSMGNGNKPTEPLHQELISQSIIRRARNILLLSFFTIGILGCLLLYFCGSESNLVSLFWKCWIFLVVMGNVHFFGYHFWRLQQIRTWTTTPLDSSSSSCVDNEIAVQRKSVYSLRSSLQFGVVIQIAVFILTALMLDGGEMMKLCTMVIIGYCLGVEIILFSARNR